MVALAYALGFGGLADSYNLANTIPNVVHDVVLGGILSATFVPVFVERLTTRSEEEASEAISAVVSAAFVVLVAGSLLFLVAAPALVDLITLGRHGAATASERALTVDLLRLFVPQLAGYGLLSLITALLNSRWTFAAPMYTPVFGNVLLIAVLVGFRHLAGRATVAGILGHPSEIAMLGAGTTLAIVVQTWLLVPSLRKSGLRLTWHPHFKHEAVIRIMRLSGWTFGFILANQLALVVVLAVSVHVGSGAVTAYTYAYTFFQLPYGVVAISIMSAVAPGLAESWSRADLPAFRRQVARGLRSMLTIVIPAAAGELVLARPIVALLLGHGAGNPTSSVPTAQALAMLALGLPGFATFLFTVRALQSMQNTRSAFWLYILENGLNIALIFPLAHYYGIRGIALSISIAYTIGALAGLSHMYRLRVGPDTHALLRPVLRVAVASVLLAVAAAFGSSITGSTTGLALLGRVVIGTAAGAAAFALSVLLASSLLGRSGR